MRQYPNIPQVRQRHRSLHSLSNHCGQSNLCWNFRTINGGGGARNREGTEFYYRFTTLYSLPGHDNNPIPTRFLAPHRLFYNSSTVLPTYPLNFLFKIWTSNQVHNNDQMPYNNNYIKTLRNLSNMKSAKSNKTSFKLYITITSG
jgi:hypothetical protein